MDHQEKANPSPATAGNAYSYGYPAAPPFYGPPPPRSYSSILFRLFLVCTAVFFLFCAGSLFFYVILRPRAPAFYLTSATVSSFKLSPSFPRSLSADFDVSLSIWNRNDKFDVSYEHFFAGVGYGSVEQMLGMGEVDLPIDQDVLSTVPVRARIAVAFGANPEVTEKIAGDLARGGAVDFDFRFSVLCHLERRWWWSRNIKLRAYCDDVKLMFANATETAGAMIGPARTCIIHV